MICKALVDLFTTMEFVFFLMWGCPFPSCVIVEVCMLQTPHIPSSYRCSLEFVSFDNGVTIIKVCFSKLPIVDV